MIAKVRRLKISSSRLLINPFQLFLAVWPRRRTHPAPKRAVDMIAADVFANTSTVSRQSLGSSIFRRDRHQFCLFYQVEIRYRQLP
jgi:hypothetical protein